MGFDYKHKIKLLTPLKLKNWSKQLENSNNIKKTGNHFKDVIIDINTQLEVCDNNILLW